MKKTEQKISLEGSFNVVGRDNDELYFFRVFTDGSMVIGLPNILWSMIDTIDLPKKIIYR